MKPDKPSRDTTTRAPDPDPVTDGGAGTRQAGAAPDEAREEKGSAAGSRRHPPHKTENTESGQVESEDDAPGDVPVLPANAQGTDTVTTAEHEQAIDETSMYDRRRDEDKDRPPSTRKG